MRIRRSVTRFFTASIIPAICAGVIAYFGYYAVMGARGYHAYAGVRTELAARQQKLDTVRGARLKLAHRIDLIEHGDRDTIEEQVRKDLVEGASNVVAVPRGH